MKNALKSVLGSLGYEIRKIPDTPQVETEGCVVAWPYRDRTIRFYLENRYDLIGKDLFNGSFFEQTELEVLVDLVEPGGIAVDVGANIGNHAVFFGTVLQASRVIAFEPGAWASARLAFNAALNGMGDRLELHRCALSDTAGTGRMQRWADDNHGTLALSEGGDGEQVRVETGDSFFEERRISLLKIDVERHEAQVLDGLDKTLRRDHPVVLIEVGKEDRAGMEARLAEYGYATRCAFERYGDIVNLILH